MIFAKPDEVYDNFGPRFGVDKSAPAVGRDGLFFCRIQEVS